MVFLCTKPYNKPWICHIQWPKKLEPIGKYFDLFMNETYYEAWLLEGG